MKQKIIPPCKENLLGELIESEPVRGFLIRSEEVSNGVPVKYINIKNIESGRIQIDSDQMMIAQKDVEKAPRVKIGDVVVSVKGTSYKAAVVGEEHENSILSPNVIGLRLKSPDVDPEYIATYLNCPEGQVQLKKLARGVGLPSINFAALKSVSIPVVPVEVQQSLTKYLSLVRMYYDHLALERTIMEEIEEYVIYTSMRG